MNVRPRLHWKRSYLNQASGDQGKTSRLPIVSGQAHIKTYVKRRMGLPPQDIGKDQWRDNRRIGLNDKLRCLDA